MNPTSATPTRLRLLPLAALCGALAFGACGDSSQYDGDAPLQPQNQGERYPGNDGGALKADNAYEEGDPENNVIGGVDSYKPDSGDIELYASTVGMETDNPSLSNGANGVGNDPVTPNGPLADGTIGQPDAAGAPTSQSARNLSVDGGQYRNTYESGDSPYGNNMQPRDQRGERGVDTSSLVGLKAYVRADGAEDMPVYVPGGDASGYVGEFYGSDPRTSPTEQPEGDFYEVSTFRPALSDVTAATYANTLTKLVNKPGSQSYRVYQPIQLKITPLLSWDVSETADRDGDVLATLGEDCGAAEDALACSSGVFQESIAPIVNDQRVARAISSGNVEGFSFELDRRGRVDMNSLRVLSGSGTCNSAQCARLKDVLVGAVAAQSWTPAQVAGQPTAARVEVPFRYDVKRLGSKVNTP